MDITKQRAAVKALIFRNDTVLLLQGGTKKSWELPGGKLEFGEDPREGLARELREELGSGSVAIEKVVDVKSRVTDIGEPIYMVFIIYACTVAPDYEFTISDEHIGGRWVPLAEAKDLPMWEIYREVIIQHSPGGKI